MVTRLLASRFSERSISTAERSVFSSVLQYYATTGFNSSINYSLKHSLHLFLASWNNLNKVSVAHLNS